MRSRVWVGGTVAGIIGIALTLFSLLPPLGESLLLGSSIGLIVVGPIGGLVLSGSPSPVALSSGAQAMSLIEERNREEKVEYERTLRNFDNLLARVERIGDPEVNDKVTKNFERFMRRLTDYYPIWNGEGRIRTYVLMSKVAERLNRENAEAYLDLVYTTLVERGDEASEMSRMSLSGKVERLYRDPGREEAHHLAGTLLLMNREDEVYTKDLVNDAIHLWNSARFDRLLPDFAAIRKMSDSAKRDIEELLQKETMKALRAGDVDAVLRSKEILDTIFRDRTKPTREQGS